MMEETIKILTQIYTLYDFRRKGRGDNFNLFEFINIDVYNKEFHNNFIAELLNVNGKHGANDVYLKLFCKIFNIQLTQNEEEVLSDIIKFKITTNTWIEHGTKVDIFLEVNHKEIYIMNLLLENNQLKQEEFEFLSIGTSNELIYLALNDLYRIEDKNNLHRTSFFVWLQECINYSSTRPVVRENLLQYFNLVSRLTKCSSNMEMTKDMIKSICNNNESINAVMHIVENVDLVKRKIMDAVVCQLKNQVLTNYNIYIRDELGEKDSFCQFLPKGWKEYHIALIFKENYSKLRIGISNMDPDIDLPIRNPELERQLRDTLGDMILGKILNCDETDFVWLSEFNWYETVSWGDIYQGKFVEHLNNVIGRIVSKTRGIKL